MHDDADQRLELFSGFGSNPGNLRARTYRPHDLGAGAPLVVVLHGCTQTPESYERGASWTSAADEHGFALLFPEQQRANNSNLCFNWYSPADASRYGGEAVSIVQMVQYLCSQKVIDRDRVYITGLSAGGAMAAAMLATYPEVFAGGAVIAGLPFGTASTVPEAFERMRGQGTLGPAQLTELVRSASNHSGSWPTLSVWHGSRDQTVDASNAEALVRQWCGLHEVGAIPVVTETIAGNTRRLWRDRQGQDVVEAYLMADMGHGTPIDAGTTSEEAGPYMLDIGFSSTRRIVAFWQLDDGRICPRDAAAPVPGKVVQGAIPAASENDVADGRLIAGPASGVQKVIEKALRDAGLMG